MPAGGRGWQTGYPFSGPRSPSCFVGRATLFRQHHMGEPACVATSNGADARIPNLPAWGSGLVYEGNGWVGLGQLPPVANDGSPAIQLRCWVSPDRSDERLLALLWQPSAISRARAICRLPTQFCPTCANCTTISIILKMARSKPLLHSGVASRSDNGKSPHEVQNSLFERSVFAT